MKKKCKLWIRVQAYAELFLEYKGVSIFHVYKDDNNIEKGTELTYWYVANPEDGQIDGFDIRKLGYKDPPKPLDTKNKRLVFPDGTISHTFDIKKYNEYQKAKKESIIKFFKEKINEGWRP